MKKNGNHMHLEKMYICSVQIMKELYIGSKSLYGIVIGTGASGILKHTQTTEIREIQAILNHMSILMG